MGLSQCEEKKATEYATAEKERKFLAAESTGEGEKLSAYVTEDEYL